MNEIHPAEADVLANSSAVLPLGRASDTAAPARTSLRGAVINLFYHKTLLRNCVLLGCIIGIVGAVLARTYYTADSSMLVLVGAESTGADLSGINPTVVSVDGLKVVQSEIQMIQTDQVLREAVEQVGPGKIYPNLGASRLFGLRAPIKPSLQIGEAVQKLRGDLRVDAEAGSSIIRLSFTHTNRDIAIQVVKAVEEAYLTARRTIYSNSSSRFLGREVDRYKVLLNSLDEQIQGVKNKYDILDMGQDIVLATNRRDGIVQRQNQVRERRVAVQTEIVAVKTNLAAQPAEVLDFKETTNNTGNDEARNTLVRLEQERTHLITLYNPQWPGIAQIDKQIANVRAQMGSAGQNLYFSQRTIRNPAIEVLNNRLASLEVEDKALSQQLVELDDQYKQSDDRIKALRDAEGQLHTLQLSRDVSEGIYRKLAERQPALVLQDSVVDERNANLRIVQPPTAPSVGRSMAISYLIGGVFMGLLLGAAATGVASLLRRVYLTPNEAERELMLPALAVFDEAVDDRAMDRQPAIANFSATLQDVTVDDQPLSSLQIMGISDGDDRVEIVRAIAVELAVGHERKALIIDLDGDGSTFCNALGTLDNAASPVKELPVQATQTQVPRLWVARNVSQSMIGDWRTSIARLQSAMDELRQEFSVLILVAAADLSRHAVRRIASVVDANVIVVRAEHTRAPVAVQLRDAIRTAGGNLLGFVFVGRKYYIPNWLYRWV